ncbi:hypothetical protein HK405_013959 [Cladochytrium tenue]|nr:hypothetical protein HK405_013959 [Cladochytrium tenue]
MELLDAVESAAPEHLLYFILQEYRNSDSDFVDYDLLVKVIRALARLRAVAPTMAVLVHEIRREEAPIGKILRQLDALVTVHRPPSDGPGPTSPATVMLFSSLMASCVERLDQLGEL